MMYDDFYATLKLKTGEEIFAKVLPSDEDDKTLLVVTNPILITETNIRGNTKYKIEPWLKTTSEDMFIIDLDDVLTISESYDMNIITMYQNFIRRRSSDHLISNSNKNNSLTRKMGYISSVDEAKILLEKIYKDL